MLQRKHFKQIILSAVSMSAICLYCITPENPYDDLKTSSQLLLKNSLGKADSLSIEDSIGKPVLIGVYRYLPKNIDSLRLTVISKLTLTSTTSNTVLDTVLYFSNISLTYDTLWKQVTFKSAGYYVVKAGAFTTFKVTLSDSATIIIHDRFIPNNSPPKWKTDTIALNGFPHTTISINLADTCVDPDNNQLSFSLLSGLPLRDTIIGSLYRFTPLVADTGNFAIHIVAADPAQLTDTLTIALTVRPTPNDSIRPTLHDSIGPILRRYQPNRDSIITAADSVTISIIATDPSGVASVGCHLGTTTACTVKKVDSVYSVNIKGLSVGSINRVSFIATDSSANKNTDSLIFFIKYEPTIADNSPPIFTKINGPASPNVTTPTVSYEYAITDANGIDSIYWTLNGTRQGYLSMDALEHYKVNATLSVQSNRIVIHAWDKSANHNRDSAVIMLNYTPSFIVRFDSKGGSAIDSQRVNYGDKATEPPIKPNWDGYSFSGWYKDDAYTTKWNFESDNVTSNIILYAKWTIIQYTISFNSQGGSQVSSEQKNYGDTVNTPNTPTYEGFDFGGWYKEPSCATKWVFGTFKITQDTTLYAKWTISMYTVTFNTNGGLPVPPTQTIKYYDTVVTPIATNRTGYTFDGWYKDEAFATKWVFGTERVIANDTLYAKWKMNPPTISPKLTNKNCPLNDVVTFTVTASGVNLSYKWQKNGTDIGGATSASYTTPPLTATAISSAPTYSCVVSNAGGNDTTSATLSVSTLADVENNVYHQVKIGNQIWTMENLKTTKYNDGTTLEDYVWYNNEISNKEKYGALYGWGMVDPTNSKKIAPAGWHVPSSAEWTTLQNYLISNGFNYDNSPSVNKIGKAMASTTDWTYSDTIGQVGNSQATNNKSGFSAMPGGTFYNYTHQDFSGLGQTTVWWSSTSIEGTDVGKITCILSYDSEAFLIGEAIKFYNHSIRLIKD